MNRTKQTMRASGAASGKRSIDAPHGPPRPILSPNTPRMAIGAAVRGIRAMANTDGAKYARPREPQRYRPPGSKRDY